MKLITNARVVSPGAEIGNGFVLMEGGKVSMAGRMADASKVNAEETIDAGGRFVFPGFIDIHSHGADGRDVCDDSVESLEHIARRKLQEGVTTWLPTTLTQPREKLLSIMGKCAEFQKEEKFTRCPGAHVEGPFINVEKAGAQNPEFVRKPDIEEMRELHEACRALIVSVAPDAEAAFDLMRSWGSNEGLATDQLEEKLTLLLTLCTDRYPADLSRIGFSNLMFASDGSYVEYRLKRGKTERDWSAEQQLFATPDDPQACPVAALREYCHRVASQRCAEPQPAVDDQGEVAQIRERDALFVDTSPELAEQMVDRLLQAGGYTPEQRAKVLRDPARLLSLPGNVKVARSGNLLASKYNKAEAVELFVNECGDDVDEVFFVDDNSDNVFNVFMLFARREAQGLPTPKVRAVWFRPPGIGRSEKSDVLQQRMLHSVLHDVPKFWTPRVAVAETPQWKVTLRQDSALVPVQVERKGGDDQVLVGDLATVPKDALSTTEVSLFHPGTLYEQTVSMRGSPKQAALKEIVPQRGLPFFEWLPTVAALCAIGYILEDTLK